MVLSIYVRALEQGWCRRKGTSEKKKKKNNNLQTKIFLSATKEITSEENLSLKGGLSKLSRSYRASVRMTP